MNVRLTMAGVFALAACVASAQNRMIAYGWDVLRTGPENILANAAAWEDVPLDGVVFSLNAKAPDGTTFVDTQIVRMGAVISLTAKSFPLLQELPVTSYAPSFSSTESHTSTTDCWIRATGATVCSPRPATKR